MANPTSVTPVADLIIHSATLWSEGEILDETALAVIDGRIAAIGGPELRTQFRASKEVDARSALVIPSFGDAHVHAIYGGVEMGRCDLSECESADEVYQTIARYAAENPDAEWILGGGWRMPFFPGGTPLASELDRIVPDRPAFLLNSDHHGAWANSVALEAAGITSHTPDPDDGRIERDADGVPSGTLHEGATELLSDVLPTTTREEGRAGLLLAQERLLAYGITAWQEAILGEYAGYPDLTSTYRGLIESGQIRAHASGALWVDRNFGGHSISDFVDQLVARRREYGSEMFDLNTAKIMVDGVPENETAAMNAPYSSTCSCGGGTGLSYFTREQLTELLPLLNSHGFNAHLHAIGDRAVRYALDAIEAVPAEIRATRRNHIAHIQVVDPEDIPRFKALGVTANVQALWASRDEQMVALTLPLLGEERANWQYPFGSLLESGATLVCGSDWPVSTPDPWQAIHVAVNRREPGLPGLEPLVAEEAVTLHEVLLAYTRETHELLGASEGVLRVGAAADLAVADRNPFIGGREDIYLTSNRMTVLGGEVVFESA